MALIGRRREIAMVQGLLDRAGQGSGGVLVLAGPEGSGRTALASLAADTARRHGFDVHRAAAVAGRPGRWAWAQLLRDAGAPERIISGLLADPGPLDLDSAAAALSGGQRRRLLVVDHADRGGGQAIEMLSALAGRAVTGPTAVLVTSAVPLGVGQELWLRALTPAEIGAVTGERRPQVRQALWAASRGMPGPARSLSAALAGMPPDGDPVVQLALLAESAEGFLDIDVGLVRLLETALPRATSQDARARLLARLARALLGDAAAADRRRGLVQDALAIARRGGDPAVLAEVLDARLHALWDPEGADDRLTAAAEIMRLARDSADLELERRGLFWRFVALMELGRVSEAESALAAFEREARAAGDAAGLMMVTARHAMLATMRGRFADAHALIGQLTEQGRQAALADTDRLVGTMLGAIAMTRGDLSGLEPAVGQLRAFARRVPGHFHDATVARILLAAGQTAEADLELQRALPGLLAGSGPRWLGAAADLAAVAVGTGNASAAARLYDVLAGYRGRLVVWAGANTVTGPVTHYLGILAAQLGRPGEAAGQLESAMAAEQDIGALPWLGWTLAALAGVLGQRDPDRAAGLRRRARDIAARLDMPGLLAELGRGTGLGGRARRVSAADERARVNVTRTLRAALDRIAAAAPAAGAHLSASVRTGRACRYQPAPGGPARWRL